MFSNIRLIAEFKIFSTAELFAYISDFIGKISLISEDEVTNDNKNQKGDKEIFENEKGKETPKRN